MDYNERDRQDLIDTKLAEPLNTRQSFSWQKH